MEKYLSIRANTALYVSIFFISLHHVFVYLTNSSILKYTFNLKISEILSIYGAASVFGIIIYLFTIKFNSNKNIKRNIYIATIIEIICLIGMYYFSLNQNIHIFISLFLIHHLLTPYILFNLDSLFEAYTHISDRGKSRGIYLTVWNTPFVIIPLITSVLSIEKLSVVYIASSSLLLPFLFLIFSYIKNPNYSETDVENLGFKLRSKLKNFFEDKLDRNSFILQSILHLYYGFIAIVLPIYLHSIFEFSWNKISLILAIMTSAFVLILIPFGNIEDKKHNEKSIFRLGVTTTILFTFLLIFIKSNFDKETSFLLFAIFLFMSHVGCSLIEISMETSFYKHVTSRDDTALLMFRMARILPYSLGLLALLFILYKIILICITCIVFNHSLIKLIYSNPQSI